MNKLSPDHLLVEVAEDAAAATELEEVTETNERRLQRLERERQRAVRESLWGHFRRPGCRTFDKNVLAEMCTCPDDTEGRSPKARMMAEQRRLAVCARKMPGGRFCGGHSAFLLGDQPLCRSCAVSADFHNGTCTAIGTGRLIDCDCGTRQRLRGR